MTITLTKEQLNTLQKYIDDAIYYADEEDTIGDHFTNIKDGVIKFVDETYTHLIKDSDAYECYVEAVDAFVAYPNVWWADVRGADKRQLTN